MAGWKKGALRASAVAALRAMGAVGAAAAEGAVLNAIGFTAAGPAAGSFAAGWMSSIAIANGVGVSAGSTYAALQAAAMGGVGLVGTPVMIAVCAAVAMLGDGDAAGCDAMHM